jgi:anti-sigma B factor antagonist
MLYSQTEYPNTTVFHLKGRLDAATTEEFEEKVLASLEQGIRYLVLDFSDLEYINSAGLRVLVMSHQRLNPQGGKVMVCGTRDYIAEIFNISGYDRVFAMYPDLTLAINDCC